MHSEATGLLTWAWAPVHRASMRLTACQGARAHPAIGSGCCAAGIEQHGSPTGAAGTRKCMFYMRIVTYLSKRPPSPSPAATFTCTLAATGYAHSAHVDVPAAAAPVHAHPITPASAPVCTIACSTSHSSTHHRPKDSKRLSHPTHACHTAIKTSNTATRSPTSRHTANQNQCCLRQPDNIHP